MIGRRAPGRRSPGRAAGRGWRGLVWRVRRWMISRTFSAFSGLRPLATIDVPSMLSTVTVAPVKRLCTTTSMMSSPLMTWRTLSVRSWSSTRSPKMTRRSPMCAGSVVSVGRLDLEQGGRRIDASAGLLGRGDGGVGGGRRRRGCRCGRAGRWPRRGPGGGRGAGVGRGCADGRRGAAGSGPGAGRGGRRGRGADAHGGGAGRSGGDRPRRGHGRRDRLGGVTVSATRAGCRCSPRRASAGGVAGWPSGSPEGPGWRRVELVGRRRRGPGGGGAAGGGLGSGVGLRARSRGRRSAGRATSPTTAGGWWSRCRPAGRPRRRVGAGPRARGRLGLGGGGRARPGFGRGGLGRRRLGGAAVGRRGAALAAVGFAAASRALGGRRLARGASATWGDGLGGDGLGGHRLGQRRRTRLRLGRLGLAAARVAARRPAVSSGPPNRAWAVHGASSIGGRARRCGAGAGLVAAAGVGGRRASSRPAVPAGRGLGVRPCSAGAAAGASRPGVVGGARRHRRAGTTCRRTPATSRAPGPRSSSAGGYHLPSAASHQPGPGAWSSSAGGYHLPSEAFHQPGPGRLVAHRAASMRSGAASRATAGFTLDTE